MSPLKNYLQHLSGFLAFEQWVQDHVSLGFKVNYTPQGIFIDSQLASKFLLGFPKHKRFGNNPFIAISKKEALWIRLLNIDRVVIRENEKAIHFVCPALLGNQTNEYPDLPPTLISLGVSNYDKLKSLMPFTHIDTKGYWFSDKGQIEIANSNPFWTKPLFMQPKGSAILLNDDFYPIKEPTASIETKQTINSFFKKNDKR